ncbi:two-component system, cell cycle response regulator DivK [Thermanaeromonas toyohensis ToBE]|uniref:Stage 0 sporulation protein A homolog n=1 Tax=Thermanaeromonas toyohensis ToBE TaxID=698762 RepID=A0A1W1VZ77_9FIRM|nr:response regulator [Thermanaeromonas toyohensis]SMB98646.1 two-component system, cell cycle response regulator DivK [Thermanaeromonas toyohensis ToBE]
MENPEQNAPLVLIVEDNPANMRLVCDLLHVHGFRILRAFNALEALKIIRHNPPDLILIDISLKGMDGLSLVKLLKTNPATKNIPIIALTAHAMKQTEEDAYAAGCQGFIVKPINTRSFPSQLREFLSGKHSK